jgi:hypothetical protein
MRFESSVLFFPKVDTGTTGRVERAAVLDLGVLRVEWPSHFFYLQQHSNPSNRGTVCWLETTGTCSTYNAATTDLTDVTRSRRGAANCAC